VRITTQLTVKDYLAAQRLHFRPKPILRWVLIALGALFVGVIFQQVLMVAQGRALGRYWWMLPAGLAYGALLFYVVLPWRVSKLFRAQPSMGEPTETTFNDEGLLLQTPRGQLRFKWAALKRWKKNKHYILVYHSNVLFHIFPRRSFQRPEEFDELAALLGKNLGQGDA
jgi:hypothetical protein